MKVVYKLWFGLVVCLIVAIRQARASPLFPQQGDYTFQENSEEEEEQEHEQGENIDDVYDEEKKSISQEEREFDKDDRKEAAERTKVASALGLRNYSSHAIEELIMTYLTGRAPERPTPKPKPIRKRRTTTATTEVPAVSTKKYKIKKASPSSNGSIMPVVIKLPHGDNGSIAINIPMDMMMAMKSHNHSTTSNMSLDEQQVKSIQTSIMKALIITERIKSMFMSTTKSPPTPNNNTESLEPENEQAQRQQQDVVRPSHMDKSSPNGLPRKEGVDEPSLDIQSPFPVGLPAKGAVTEDPLKGFNDFMAQIRNKLPEYVWQGILNLSKSNYGEMAVDAVECAVFRHCPDHTSLGENIKYLI